METILQDYLNRICCSQTIDGLNRYTFATGHAPSLAEMETKLMFTLLNPRLDGDTWYFDNVDYSVPDYAFSFKNMIGLVFADGVLGIGNSSFESNEITNLVIPDSVSSIGNYAFSRNKIETLTLGSGFTTTGSYAFANNQLTNLNIYCDTLGDINGYNNIFFGNTGKEIIINALAVHETSNSGYLDGNLQYLADNNTVTFNWI